MAEIDDATVIVDIRSHGTHTHTHKLFCSAEANLFRLHTDSALVPTHVTSKTSKHAGMKCALAKASASAVGTLERAEALGLG